MGLRSSCLRGPSTTLASSGSTGSDSIASPGEAEVVVPTFKDEPWFADSALWPDPTYEPITEAHALQLYGWREGRMDVLLLAVNEEEFKALVQRFLFGGSSKPPFHTANVGLATVHFGHVGDLSIGVIQQERMGPSGQAALVGTLIERLKPRALISVGVGWGSKTGFKGACLGDVMVSKSLVEFSNNTRMGIDGVLISRSEKPAAGTLLFSRFSSAIQPGKWQFARPESMQADASIPKTCNAKAGEMATGGVLIDNKNVLETFKKSPDFQRIIGGEMEAWGLYQAVTIAAANLDRAIEWIVVKGICDWGYGKTKGWQPLAAASASDLVFSVLSSPGFLLGNNIEAKGGLLQKIERSPIFKVPINAELISRVDNACRSFCSNEGNSSIGFYGFTGMGGIGKTTLAEGIYNTLVSGFSLHAHASFELETGSSWERDTERQINWVLKQLGVGHGYGLHESLKLLADRIRGQKVLMLFDNVISLDQVEALIDCCESVNPSSCILFTCRNADNLPEDKMANLFKVDLLSHERASDLLFEKAGLVRSALLDKQDILGAIDAAVEACGRLPLALKVIGSYMRNHKTDVHVWKDVSQKIVSAYPGSMHAILNASFASLDPVAREMFLDIAGSLAGRQRGLLLAAWRNIYSESEAIMIHFNSLLSQSLITLDKNTAAVGIHSVLKELGREKIRCSLQSDGGPALLPVRKQSRVWSPYSEACFKPFMTQELECTSIEVDGQNLAPSPVSTVPKFSELHFLLMANPPADTMFGSGSGALSNSGWFRSLRWIEWPAYPFENFDWQNASQLVYADLDCGSSQGNISSLEGIQVCTNLVYLRVRFRKLNTVTNLNSIMGLIKLQTLILLGCNRVKVLPIGMKQFAKLENLNLQDCSSLTVLPDGIAQLANLHTLYLGGCSSLTGLPIGIGQLTKLQTLNFQSCIILHELSNGIGKLVNLQNLDFRGCSSLEVLPFGFERLTSLQSLDFRSCVNLKALPKGIGDLANLYTLDLRDCCSLEELPNDIGKLTNLQNLDLRDCSLLEELPFDMKELSNLKNFDLRNCSSLQVLPDGIGQLANLHTLHLEGCSSLLELPDGIIGKLKLLQTLDLRAYSSLRTLPNDIGMLADLEILYLGGCRSLTVLPDGIGLLGNLQTLILRECNSLEELPCGIGQLTSLQHLDLRSCKNLKELPAGIQYLANLDTLYLGGCSSLKELPQGIVRKLVNLGTLDIQGCSSLKNLPDGIEQHTNLQNLDFRGCSSLKKLPNGIGQLSNLLTMCLWRCSSLVVLPDCITKLKRLQNLDFRGCNSLEVLPDGIGQLTNLQSLNLQSCSSLKDLPNSIKQLTNLQSLDLRGCSSLKELPYGIGQLSSLHTLCLWRCSNLVVLPDGITKLKKLINLDIRGCSSLEVLPGGIKELNKLRTLNLQGCTGLKPQVLPNSISNLRQDSAYIVHNTLRSGMIYTDK